MKTNNREIKSAASENWSLTPRQPAGVCRKGTFY